MTTYTADFSGKEIIRAVFASPSHENIMIEYYTGAINSDGTRVITKFYVPADINHSTTKALFAEGYDFERIQKETIIFNSEQSMVYKRLIKSEAQHEIQRIKIDHEKKLEEVELNYEKKINELKLSFQQRYEEFIQTNNISNQQDVGLLIRQSMAGMGIEGLKILESIVEHNTDADVLFKTKVKIFEMPDFKQTLSKEQKQKIRSANSLFELFSYLNTTPLQDGF